jgi:hypothetical protein
MMATIAETAPAPPNPWTKRATTSTSFLGAGEAAGGGGEREDRHADEEDPAPADQVAKPAAEQEEAPEGDEIGVEHPGQRGLAEVQVTLDRRQRDGDDRAVHDAHQLTEADDGESDPAGIE